MDNKRSPNYPSISLPEAIELARQLWSKEKRAAMPQDVAARALGYKGINGLVRMKLSSLKKYGLLEGRGSDGVRLTDPAVHLVQYGPESQEYHAALQEAALRPELFREVHDSHADASDDNLRAYLVTKKGFAEAGAKQFIRAFRETLAVANIAPGADNADVSQHESTRHTPPPAQPPPATPEQSGATAGEFLLSIPYAKGLLSVRVKVTGDEMRPSYLAKVRKYLEFAENDWAADGDTLGVPPANPRLGDGEA